MSRYFNVSHGLRGCYMPDNSQIVKVTTRRELKEHVAASRRMGGVCRLLPRAGTRRSRSARLSSDSGDLEEATR